MFRFLPVIAILAMTDLAAADFSGKWAGTIETNGSRMPIYLTFTQNGGSVGGSVATGTNTKAVAIDNADLRDDAVSFEAHDNANRLMKFRLTLNGGVLGGEATVGIQVSKIAVVQVSEMGLGISTTAGGGRGDRIGSGAGSGAGSGTGSSIQAGIGSGAYRVGGGVSAPVLIHKVEPEYTEEARAAKYQGTVTLYAEIAPDGTATNIRILHSLGLGLDQKAIEAVRQWQFKPGQKDGKPVTVAATIEVNFRL